MKASEFVKHLEQRGVVCKVRDGRMLARGASTLPPRTRQALAAHRDDITRYVRDGEDRELKPTVARAELRRLGFLHLETGEWSHPRGDAVGDAILLGLISPDEVEVENKRATKEAIALGATPIPPKAVPVKDLREIYPGRYRWSEHEGVHHKDPFPRLSRITEY